MVNRIPLVIGIVLLAVFVWGYAVTVDQAFFDAAADGANRLFGLHDRVSLFGLSIPVSWPIIAFVLMIPVAIVSGLMPGGGLPFLVVVLAFATELDPFIALPVVIGYMAANDLTEPIPSILLGIPGARSSQATILDGYPLARQGYAGYALGASYTSSLIGGIIGGHRAACGPPVRPRTAAALRLGGVLPARAARHMRRRHRERGRYREGAAHRLPRPVHRHDRVREHRERDPRDLRHRLPLRWHQHRSRRGGPFRHPGDSRPGHQQHAGRQGAAERDAEGREQGRRQGHARGAAPQVAHRALVAHRRLHRRDAGARPHACALAGIRAGAADRERRCRDLRHRRHPGRHRAGVVQQLDGRRGC